MPITSTFGKGMFSNSLKCLSSVTIKIALLAMASLALASCAGDYDDWANPQANEQEASAAEYGVTFA